MATIELVSKYSAVLEAVHPRPSLSIQVVILEAVGIWQGLRAVGPQASGESNNCKHQDAEQQCQPSAEHRRRAKEN